MNTATYDILVIGGGPAGLMAAREAAQKSIRTLLIEKGNRLSQKVCGEAVSADTLAEAGLSSSGSFVCTEEINRVFVYPPNEKKGVQITTESLGYSGGFILNKAAFLEEMACLAIQDGAEIWMGAQANQLVRRDKLLRCTIATENGDRVVEAKIVIGCDGANSLVARTSFNRDGYRLIACLQYRMDNCELLDQRSLEIFFGNDIAPGGYVWIFPKGEGLANVGIGTQGVTAQKGLDSFIKAHPRRFGKAQLLGMGAAPIPLSGQIEEPVQDGLMLCGDAAGQAIPLTGAGIHSGIAAGKIAGQVAAGALMEDDTSRERLSLYPQQFNKVWGKRIAESLKVQQMIEELSDQELNQLGDILTGRDIIDLANGQNIARVAMRLLKYPAFAAKIATALLR